MRACVSASRLVRLLALGAMATLPAHAGDNGYLSIELGSARADFTDGTAGSSQLQFRFAGARDINRHVALELGVAFAKGFQPPEAIAATNLGTHVKIVSLDGSALLRLYITPSTRLFLAAGPAVTSARVELSSTDGNSVEIKSHQDFTVRIGGGVDYIRGYYTAVRFAVEHLQSVGSDNPESTGRSTLDTVSIGILLLF